MVLWECCLCQAQVAGDADSVAWVGWRRIVHDRGSSGSICPTCRRERASDVCRATLDAPADQAAPHG
jgi:hypothetical protein